ncbi:hypothetical protein Q8F55_008316 [Vanrija albida]|uniref:Glycosyl hydrolase family 13 catalytic domain-containing protein n=1 Tax=Vanrija albida TaxID=181172 RepID=A0ABR3PW34_9TREE
MGSVDSTAYQRKWWKEANVYQIYPASFADHAANGHGTLRGITERVPYLKELGIDVVWVSPIFESPQADMGYDISDYRKIDPRYGDLNDWDALRDACHERGMKLVMDLVVNHSSDKHAWFTESRSNKTNPKRDFYYWHPGKVNEKGERVPPNNWRSRFGLGSAWRWDEQSQEYYFHQFLKEQPDLNWTNPELRNEVYEMMRWWLDRGCDGFRMDVINFIAKAPGWPDAPINDPDQPFQAPGNLAWNRPEVHPFLQEMHEKVLKDYDAFCVGEAPGKEGPESFAVYSRPENNELQMVFNFHTQYFDRAVYEKKWNKDWNLSNLKKIFTQWHTELPAYGGWMANYLENHDQPRMTTRVGSELPEWRAKSAKLNALFHTSLTGTIFVFQGQEIGQVNLPREWPEEEYKDVSSVQRLAAEREWCDNHGVVGEAKEAHIAKVRTDLREAGRDNGRTPMQWDTTEYAGFSKAEPWMRVLDDYPQWNVASQKADPDSVWYFYQKLLALRKEYLALVYGTFIPLDEESEENYSYIREDEHTGEKLLVLLNFARGEGGPGGQGHGTTITVDPKAWGVDVSKARLLVSNDGAKVGSGIDGPVTLDNWAGRVYVLQEKRLLN